jgi:hypothetical protein
MIVIVTGLTTFAAPAPAGATGVSGSCVALGSSPLSFSAGSFFASRPASYTYTTYDSLCTMPDPTVHSGVEHGAATGTLDCVQVGGSFTGQFTVTWNNGRTSTADYVESIVGGFNQSHGVFVAGEFAGMSFHHVGVDAAVNPLTCFAPAGTLLITYTGAYAYSG